MINIHVDTRAFQKEMDRIPVEIARAIRIGLKEGAQVLINGARVNFNAHFEGHSGKGEASIQVDPAQTTDTSITVGLNKEIAEYSVYLHEGTGIYGKKKKSFFVKPVNAKALHWVGGKADFFSKGHEIQGIEGHKFLEDAAEEKREEMVKSVLKQIEEAIRKAGQS